MKHYLLLLCTIFSGWVHAQSFDQYEKKWGTYYGPPALQEGNTIITNDNNSSYIDPEGNIILLNGKIDPNGYFSNPIYYNYFSTFRIPEDNPMMYNTGDRSVTYYTKFSPTGEVLAAGYLPIKIRTITFDHEGNIIGLGSSSDVNYATSGTWFDTLEGFRNRTNNVIIFKLDANFNKIWASFLPASDNIDKNHVLTDADGSIYSFIQTYLTDGVTTPNVFQSEFIYNQFGLNSRNGLLFKLSSNGEIIWSTYTGNTLINSVHLHGNDLYVLQDLSYYFRNDEDLYPSNDFYLTENAQQRNRGQILISKFSKADGNRTYSSFFGQLEGPFLDYDSDAILVGDKIYIAGYTEDLGNNSPFISENANQPHFGGGYIDTYLAKLDVTQNAAFDWGTYIGGNGIEGEILLKFKENNLYLAMITSSPDISFPEDQSSFYYGGNYDGILLKFNSNGRMIWGNYLGGEGDEFIFNSLLIENDRSLFIGGLTNSYKNISTPNSHRENYLVYPNPQYQTVYNYYLMHYGEGENLGSNDSFFSPIQVYPNPANNHLYVKGIFAPDSLLEIHNLVGQKVASQKASNFNTIRFDISILPKGVYLLSGKDSSGNLISRKWVKE